MERKEFGSRPDSNNRPEPDNINPFVLALIVRTQIDQIIKEYEHQRFIEAMNA